MIAEHHADQLAEIKALAGSLRESTEVVARSVEELRSQLVTPGGEPPGAHGPLLAFVHIPKTAGATVISMLVNAYSKRDVRDAGNYLKGPEKTANALARPRKAEGKVLAGHVPYGVFKEYLPHETRYMTFLREPVDRVLSHYYRHVFAKDPRVAKEVRRPGRRENRKPVDPDEARRAALELLDEAIVEKRLPELNNLCTRFLSGHPPLEDLDPRAVEDAKENLRGFAFVGIQERFQESLGLLQRLLGVGSLPYVSRHVSGAGDRPSVDELPERERRLIEEHNALDAELYAFGLELFEKALVVADEGD